MPPVPQEDRSADQGELSDKIDKLTRDRLWDSLMEMAKIGPGVAGGNNRQTLTDEDAEGRALFQRGARRRADHGRRQMGNMFMRREGTDPDALPVYVGSHLDTQPTGGKYDGVLGVLAGWRSCARSTISTSRRSTPSW
jgi:N-carbamoyl-L-amino-acid hydrolase